MTATTTETTAYMGIEMGSLEIQQLQGDPEGIYRGTETTTMASTMAATATATETTAYMGIEMGSLEIQQLQGDPKGGPRGCSWGARGFWPTIQNPKTNKIDRESCTRAHDS